MIQLLDVFFFRKVLKLHWFLFSQQNTKRRIFR